MPKVECKVESLEIRSIHIGAYCYRISTSRLQNHLWGILVVAGIRLGVFCRPSCCCCLSGSCCWFLLFLQCPWCIPTFSYMVQQRTFVGVEPLARSRRASHSLPLQQMHWRCVCVCLEWVCVCVRKCSHDLWSETILSARKFMECSALQIKRNNIFCQLYFSFQYFCLSPVRWLFLVFVFCPHDWPFILLCPFISPSIYFVSVSSACVCVCVRLQMYFVGVATPLSWGQVQIPEMAKKAFGLNICSLFAANVHNIFEISSGNLSWNGEMLTQLLQ